MGMTGLGPHGERAVPADKIGLSDSDASKARAGRFNAAVVLHTTSSDWARQQLAGIAATLGAFSAAVVEVVDCGFDPDRQNSELLRLADISKIDAVFSIPLGNASVAPGHKAVARAGKKLVLFDNAPSGLAQGEDYVAVVSSDNVGLGEIAAELLSPFIPEEGVAGMLTYSVDFFATNEREIGFRKWIGRHRPDLTIVRERFNHVEGARAAFAHMLGDNGDLDALFAAWDVLALGALEFLRAASRSLAVTTCDLGNAIAVELSGGEYVKGVVAQLPYDQGRAAALVSLLALVGRSTPSWIATPGLPVTRANVVEAYQVVWHMPAPDTLRRLRR
jgi:ribose transport system substrate-binding protein